MARRLSRHAQGSSDPRSPPPEAPDSHPPPAPRGGRRLTPGHPPPNLRGPPGGGPLAVNESRRARHQVGDEVLGVLAAGRVADEAVRDVVGAPARAALGGRGHAAERRRLGDERAGVEQRLSARRDATVKPTGSRSASSARAPRRGLTGDGPRARPRARAAPARSPPRPRSSAQPQRSVASERCASHASNAPGTEPDCERQRRSAAISVGRGR